MKPEILASLTAFEQVAASRSLTQGAHALGVTPAALSQTIKKLETRLGVRLFERTTRSLNLTEAGRAYLERVAPALASLKGATEDLQSSAGVEGGTLRVTLGYSAGRFLIEPLLAGFFAAHPHIGLELAYDDGLVDIVREGFDLGIRIGEAVERDMIALRLTPEFRLRCAASPAYLRAHGTPRRPQDLARHRCINYRMRSSGALYKWEFMDGEALTELAVRGPLVVNHWEAGLNAAIAGVGLIIGWAESLAPVFRSGELVEVLADCSAAFPGFYAYYPQRAHLPVKTRVFLDFLTARLPTMAP
ncbi:LysR family transcriptional regulator [Variovorax terrae]|uniref:LysR family transcriptional regulator n=1 Tax=Variovorax terrae TaxID=2923278 RepID=A0A9X2AL49_9BURK|nr:LysR family transcriptional regulator [Variovorax terrae]MCJ0762303.1 LysR family transcriptional regulator [Variovorax terrae]